MRLARAAGVRRAGGWAAWLTFVLVFAVAAAIAAGGDVFAAAVGDRLAADQATLLDDRGPAILGRAEGLAGPSLLEAVAAVEGELASVPGVDGAVATLAVGGGQTTASAGGTVLTARVRIFSRGGAEEALDLVAGAPGGGVLISARAAAELGLGPGDDLQLRDPQWGVQEDVVEGASATLRVAGVYADLDVADLGPYWARVPSELRPREFAVFGGIVEPELLVAPPELIAGLAGGPVPVRIWWEERSFVGAASRDELAAIDRSLQRLERTADDPASATGAAVATAGIRRVEVESEVTERRQAVDEGVAELEAAILPVEIGAVLVGFAAIALGAWFVARLRRDELRMWSVEGRSPAALGLGTASAAAVPAVMGTALGAVAAPWLVAIGSPSRELHAGAIAYPVVVGVAAAGLAVVAVTVAAAARRSLQPAARRLWWAADLALVAAGGLVIAQVLRRDPADVDPTALDPAAALLPLVGIAAVVVVLARLIAWGVHRLRRTGPGPPALFLAWRRLVAALGSRTTIVVVVGVAAGVVVLATSIVDATDDALEAKAIVVVGSDASAGAPTRSLPPVLPERVALVRSGSVSLAGEGRVTLLLIDPDGYADAVRWHESFELTPGALLGMLDGDGRSGVPAVAAGPGASRRAASGVVRLQLLTLPYRIEGRVEALPGMSTVVDTTLVVRADVVARWVLANPVPSGLAQLTAEGQPADEAVARLLRAFTGRLVTSRDPGALAALLEQAGRQDAPVLTRAEVAARPEFVTRRWAFDYLRRVAVAGLAMSFAVFAFSQVQARRDRAVARALTRRMGLRRGTEPIAAGAEIAALAGAAVGLGAAAGLGLGALVVGRLDPLPNLPPGVGGGWPLDAAAVPAIAGAVAVALTWALATRSAAAADVAEVLRRD